MECPVDEVPLLLKRKGWHQLGLLKDVTS
jgi:hypothetical protein